MTFRDDIQALRGFAILTVLLFHAGIGPFTAGHLGVDIFFVISGFLITGMIARSLQEKRFSFKTFYYRRAKRLLPAAYSVLLLTIIGSLFFLTQEELNHFKNQVLGAVTFSANFALRDQADYFGGAAEFKPLLHFWSLAIEEQFYFVMPLLLFFAPQRFWKPLLIAAFGISLIACLIGIHYSARDTFYFLPTRAWELLIGSLTALYFSKREKLSLNLRHGLCGISVLVLIAIPLFPLSEQHPSIDAILVTLATGVLIFASPYTRLPMFLLPLKKLGDYSYSLYLVHWPLFAFAFNAYMKDSIPQHVSYLLLVVSLVLAVVLYHTIEYPLHKRHFERKKMFVWAMVLGAVILAAFAALATLRPADTPDYKHLMRGNTGLARECDQRTYTPFEACQTSNTPQLMIWGDSIAMHVVPGLTQQIGDAGLIQATKSSCAPALGLSFYKQSKYARAWAEQCIDFNDGVIAHLATLPSVEYVALSTTFKTLAADGTYHGLVRRNDGTLEDIMLTPDMAAAALQHTVDRIRALGKKVVIISPAPVAPFNMGQCLERSATGKITLGPNQTCPLHKEDVLQANASIYAFLDRMADAGTPVIRLDDMLCPTGPCLTTLNGTLLYRDKHHLSYAGSREVANYIKLATRIMAQAR